MVETAEMDKTVEMVKMDKTVEMAETAEMVIALHQMTLLMLKKSTLAIQL